MLRIYQRIPVFVHREPTLVFQTAQWRSTARASDSPLRYIPISPTVGAGASGDCDGGGGGGGGSGGGGWVKIFCVGCHSERPDVGKAPKHRL